jgi:hypothetical protein
MKRSITIILLGVLLHLTCSAQPVKGIIYADTSDILIVKVWGTHQERGYALGFLTGDRITDIIVNYVKPEFGAFYNTARNIITTGNDITIPQDYLDEAQSIIDGMNASGTNTSSLDKTDILVGNTFLDVSNLLFMQSGMNCSALMSWNDATAGTDLDGKAVVTRHLDWEYSTVLNRNHIITVHFPSEQDESKWLLVGFSGMMSVLSGFNPDFSAFQNMLDDFSGLGQHGKHYIPIWLALRRALESNDYNGDGARNVLDVKKSLQDCPDGFADGFIVSSMGRSDPADSLVAMVAELAPANPKLTFRTSAYPDSIPGDNLYTANYMIARNNMMHFCFRYNGIRNNIGDGTGISLDTSWNLMRDHSHLPTNTQFMQFAPELDYFRMSVYRNGQPAYMNEPVVFNLQDLFNDPTTGVQEKVRQEIFTYPNPTSGLSRFSALSKCSSYEITDVAGSTIQHGKIPACAHFNVDFSNYIPGIYFVKISTETGVSVVKVICNR